jgi:hypothetical protein
MLSVGNPGSGKSVLASLVLQKLYSSSAGATICYYFFHKADRGTDRFISACRAILLQIVHTHRRSCELVDLFSFCLTESNYGQSTASSDELADLVAQSTRLLGRVIFVIDGLDECPDGELLQSLIQKLAANDSTKSIVFSRPAVSWLRTSIPDHMRINIKRRNTPDIRRYLKTNLSHDAQRTLLLEESASDYSLNTLAECADGMFLWARLFMGLIRSNALTPKRRQGLISKASLLEFKDLDKLYSMIFALIRSTDEYSQQLAKHVFLWLVHSKRRLTTAECHQAHINTWDGFGEEYQPNAFEDSVIITCGGLVETTPVHDSLLSLSARHSFRFIHSSVQEHLLMHGGEYEHILGTSEDTRALTTPAVEAHLQMAQTCLAYLMDKMPTQWLSGRAGVHTSQVELLRDFPFSQYASFNWPFHLLSSISGVHQRISVALPNAIQEIYRSVINLVDKFFLSKLKLNVWIEACYIYESPPPSKELAQWGAGISMEYWQSILCTLPNLSCVIRDIRTFSDYLDLIEHDWGWNLRRRPGCIWEEVTAFSPSQQLAQPDTIRVCFLNSADHPGDRYSPREFSKISQSSPDSSSVVTLKIWPSK